MARPTIRTICAETGLSTATVSKALRQSPQVRPETRKRVEEVARRLGYSANLDGVRLRTGKTFQIAAVMAAPEPGSDEWEGVEYAPILSGISRAVEGTGYRVAIHAVRDFAESVDAVQRIVRERLADGVILSQTRVTDERVAILQEAGMPFVTYGTTGAHPAHPFVDADNAGVVRQTVLRLAAAGHRRIALINPPHEQSYARTRSESYRRALSDVGLSHDPALEVAGRLTPEAGRAAVMRLAARPEPPTAYVCANEAVALGALSGFAAAGLVHGRDAIINATDDLNISAYLNPPISTYFLPIHTPAAWLGDHILRAMAGEPPEDLQTLLMPAFIARSDDRLQPGGER
ncbi:MAG: LacI family DNA-binding transcriptional regulator [Paracoccaceae bacterium]